MPLFLRWGLLIPALIFAWAGVLMADNQPIGQPKELLQIAAEAVPPDLLSPAEVERIKTLAQIENPGYLGAFNPGGTVVLLEKDTGLGFYTVATNTFTALASQPNTPIQCPDDYQVEDSRWVAWISDLEIQLIAQKKDAKGILLASAWCRINRLTLARTLTQSLPITPGEVIKSVSPNGQWTLIATAANPAAQALAAGSTPPAHPTPDPLDIEIPAQPFGSHSLKILAASQGVRLVLIETATGHRRELMTLPPGTTFYEVTGQLFAWSQAGNKLGFVRTVIPTANRTQDSLLQTFTQSALGQLQPEDNPLLTQNALEVFDLTTGVHQQLTGGAADQSLIFSVAFSPNGSRLTAITLPQVQLQGRKYPVYAPGNMFGHYQFYDSQLQRLGAVDTPIYYQGGNEPPVMTGENEAILTVTQGLSKQIYRYALAQRELVQLTTVEGNYTNVVPNPASHEVYFRFDAYQAPVELYRLAVAGAPMTALTDLNRAARLANAIQVSKVSFPIANRRREAYLLAPRDAQVPSRTLPMVLWQQGGPGVEMVNQWGAVAEAPFNLLPNFGIAVLVLPLEMRPGWGAANWNRLADGKNYGQVDIDAAAQFMRKLIAKGYTAADRIGITGCSYGGYFTSQSITRHPGLYRAANPQCSLLDLVTEFETGYASFIGYLEGRTPFAALSEYRRDSPVFAGHRVKTPTLIFHGEKDFLPVGIAQNFYAQIAAGATPARMVEFLGERHGVSNQKLSLYQTQEQINWFRYYLVEQAR